MSANIPVACTLSDADLQARSREVAELFAQATHVEEVADGYAFAFPSGSEWAHQLLDFADFERACCPFFSFSLRFPSPHEAIWLDVRGQAPEVKEMIRTGFRARAVNAA
jgi:hypothetical protein